jgi:hypothetical protein
MQGLGKGALCLSSSLSKPLQRRYTVHIASRNRDINQVTFERCIPARPRCPYSFLRRGPAKGLMGSVSGRGFWVFHAPSRRAAQNSAAWRLGRLLQGRAQPKARQEVRNYFPGTMEQAPCTGHGTSPQSGLGKCGTPAAKSCVG